MDKQARNCHHGQMSDAASTAAFRAARDFLLRHHDDYDTARREFAWPELTEFNWALDWFDVLAAEHPDRLALRVVGDAPPSGGTTPLTPPDENLGGSDVTLT